SKQPKKLWSTLQSLLSLKTPTILPTSISTSCLAQSFLDFFKDKIARLSSSLTPNFTSSPHLPPSSSPPPFNTFSPTSHDEVRHAILMSSSATCSLDTIPTFLLKSCLDSLITPITNIINLSFLEGTFPTSFKDALVYPLLKKHNLPHEDLSSYRPISNVNFLSKIVERIILFRMNAHFQTFPSLCPLQSAYRKFHSTETAYFESITTYCVHLIVVKSLLLFFLISLLLLTQLTIKSCLIDLLPSMVSQVLP